MWSAGRFCSEPNLFYVMTQKQCHIEILCLQSPITVYFYQLLTSMELKWITNTIFRPRACKYFMRWQDVFFSFPMFYKYLVININNSMHKWNIHTCVMANVNKDHGQVKYDYFMTDHLECLTSVCWLFLDLIWSCVVK